MVSSTKADSIIKHGATTKPGNATIDVPKSIDETSSVATTTSGGNDTGKPTIVGTGWDVATTAHTEKTAGTKRYICSYILEHRKH